MQMLFGEHTPSIDSQYRISIPAKFRSVLGEEFMIVKALHPQNRFLRIYTMEGWRSYLANLKSTLTLEQYERVLAYYSGAVKAEPDSLGRVRVGKEMWDHIRVDFSEEGDKEIIVIGCHEYGEIWLKKDYREYMAAMDLQSLYNTISQVRYNG